MSLLTIHICIMAKKEKIDIQIGGTLFQVKAYSARESDKIMRTFLEKIRQAVAESGLPHAKLAERARMSQPTLTRFLNGQTSLGFDSAALLLDSLGLEIGPKAKAKKKAASRN
jgi:ribosome-binding protein aMBF1 (putative translation factor)